MRSISLAQCARLLNCQNTFPNALIKGYCIDSRLLKSGELFFALPGNRVDGHAFLQEVKQKGAIGAVVSKQAQCAIDGLPLLHVNDPLEALQDLAHLMLANQPSRIIAITGSLGKTTTKEFIKTLLASKYRVAASPGNSNSQVGVPLSILNHSAGEEEILILEMGMTHPGQISKLVQIAPPEVAVITTLALVHACNFDSLADIGRSKGEIFSHPLTQVGILPREISEVANLSKTGACKKITFSVTSEDADYALKKAEVDKMILQSNLEKMALTLNSLSIPGRHNHHNALAAIAIARYFNVDWPSIAHTISSLTLPEKRLQFVRRRDILFLNDSYNAAEPSVKSALETLPDPQREGRKIAVLGGMAELGKFSEGCHQRVGEFALRHVERMYCLGQECLPIVEIWRREGRPVLLFDQLGDLVSCLQKDLKAFDVVLLKGSRSKELWKVLEEFEND